MKLAACSNNYHRIFGPVASRRLGQSLGIDLVQHKTCTLDCRYCECGPTTLLTMERSEYVPLNELLSEIRARLPQLEGQLDHVTFSGSGEPTLSTSLGAVTAEIKRLTQTPVALLTNGTLLHHPDIISEISAIDILIPSLDAADAQTFRLLNRPHPDLDFELYLSGLRSLRTVFHGKIYLEILLCRGINDSIDHLRLLNDEVHRIRPDAVQLNTVIRPGTDLSAKPLSEAELNDAARFLDFKIQLPLLSGQTYHTQPIGLPPDLAQRVMAVLSRRPSSAKDLADGLNQNQTEIQAILDRMLDEKRIQIIPGDNKLFYRATEV
jgi:wyosine [tRNA(Phe)-imidazoG37] synthetase (radical SAM superfamily)